MKNLKEIASPITFISIFLAAVPLLPLFFKPSIGELLTLLVVDGLMSFVAMKADIFLFTRYFPQCKSFFPEINRDEINSQNLSKKKELFHDMMKYPLKRSLYMFPANCIKAIPAILIALFYWDHKLDFWIACFYVVCIELFVFSYFSAIIYFENHSFLSLKIKEIHRIFDWSEVFISIDNLQKIKRKNYNLVENISILAIWIFAAPLFVTINLDDTQGPILKAIESLGVCFFACFYTLRIILMSRRGIKEGIDDIFEFFGEKGNLKASKLLPYNTLPEVMYFQQTLNNLLQKNLSNEKEISSWIIERAEKNRFIDLGNIAGLVVHDLVNPLHHINYCINSLEENHKLNGNKYISQLTNSVKHTLNLVENLKNNIRNSSNAPQKACIFQANETVKNLLKFHFTDANLKKFNFSHQNLRNDLYVRMPQTELNQIFTNLYTNSIKNILGNDIKNPKIEIILVKDDKENIAIIFKDNGTGITAKNFDFITTESHNANLKSGIGLQLTRRLIEYYEGSLQVKENTKENVEGTIFHIELKKYQTQEIR